jgi:hypothetical protein
VNRVSFTGLREYVRSRLSSGLKVEADLSKFSARLAMVDGMSSLKIDGLSDATARGYQSLIKIAFLYSALDLIREDPAIRGQVSIKNVKVAEALKAEEFRDLRDYLLHSSDSDTLREDLDKFFRGTSADLLPVVRSMRNTMFHGALTPHAGGRPTLRRLKVYEELLTVVSSEVRRLGNVVTESRTAK